MTGAVKNTWFWTAGSVFLAVIIFTLSFFSSWYIQFMTAMAVAGCGILFYLAGIRWAFHITLISLPLSVNLPVIGDSLVMFPSELLVMALGLSVFMNWIRNGQEFMAWLKHPVTVSLAGYLIFLMISLVFSEMVLVSLKSVIIKCLYIISFFGGAYIYFRNTSNNGKFILYYLLPLILVIGTVLTRHAGFEFSKDVSGFVTKPFYQDHTIYSAAMAFMLPLAVFQVKSTSGGIRIVYILICLLFVAAIIIAGSRAAWLSVGLTLCFGLLLLLRMPVSGFVILTLLSVAIAFNQSENLLWKLKLNRSDSNARNADITDQTRSVINITNDQSNAERLNRWKCAWRMFNEKPLTGFGPGTYQFIYFPFQREKEMTRISVTSPYNIQEGRGGTAHNEFLLVLSESGAGAAICFLLMVILTFVSAIRVYYHKLNGTLSLFMLLAFSTFVIHSLFNNFLDTDKTAALFYVAMGFFVARNQAIENKYGNG